MVELIFFASIVLVFATIYLLLFTENATKSYADYVLSFLLLMQTWSAFLYLLLNSKYIFEYPHLFKTALPGNFLIAPLSYLYVRIVLFNEKKIKTIDLVHMLPFLFILISYIPFYALPVSEKLNIINLTVKDWSYSYKIKSGLFPEKFNYILRQVLAVVYLIFQWNLVIKYKKVHKTDPIQFQITNVLKWLRFFTWTTTIVLFGFLILTFSVILLPGDYNKLFVIEIPSLFISGAFFAMSSYLITHPSVLTGLPFLRYRQVESDVVKDKRYSLPYINENYIIEMEKIVHFFETQKPFLNKELNINQVSVALDIPSRELSFIINNHFGQRFNDFLNKYRIEHITKKINKEYLSNFTIEAIASEAGFASKSTFNLAFKKHHQCTPSEYFSKF